MALKESEKPFFATGFHGQIEFLSWMSTTTRLLPCEDGMYNVQPDVDRWTQVKDEAFPTTQHPWDQISGKYCYKNMIRQSRTMI